MEAKFDLFPKEKVLTNPDIYSQMVDVFSRGYSKADRWMGNERFESENISNTSMVAALFAGEGEGVAFATLNKGRITAISAQRGYGTPLLRDLAGSSEFSFKNPLWITVDVTAMEMINAVMSRKLNSQLIQDRLQVENLYAQINGVDVTRNEHRVNITTIGRDGLKVWPLLEPYQIPGVLKGYASPNKALLAHHRVEAELHPISTYLQYTFIINP